MIVAWMGRKGNATRYKHTGIYTTSQDAKGVWYTGGKGAIFNQDLAGMPVNAAFNVIAFSNRRGFLPLARR